MPEVPETEPGVGLYVYQGKRLNAAGTALVHYLRRLKSPAEVDESDDGLAVFSTGKRDPLAAMTLGSVWRIPVTLPTFFFGQKEAAGTWDCRSEVEAWTLAERAARTVINARKMAEKVERDADKLERLCGPLRLRYTRLRTSSERTAFELLVLHAIRGTGV